jgi:hypothetical protein
MISQLRLISLPTGSNLERVAGLNNLRQTGYFNFWLGLAPDDSPLLLRDIGTKEMYGLDLLAP